MPMSVAPKRPGEGLWRVPTSVKAIAASRAIAYSWQSVSPRARAAEVAEASPIDKRLGDYAVKPVVTLTVNPALDAACVADEVVPMRKVRTRDERYDPGGGGINVARMIRELGGEAVAFYLAGGITGQALEGLIERSGIAAVRVPIAGLTRVSLTVYETSTGHEFRFTPEGPEVTQAECHNCLEVLSATCG